MTWVPTERQEQITLFAWVDICAGKYPELRLMHHIPNGGRRDKREAADFKRQGVLPGVPDNFLPVARGGHHGLYIELKRIKGGSVSAAQKSMIDDLRKQGYRVEVCRGWEAASDAIMNYLKSGEEK